MFHMYKYFEQCFIFNNTLNISHDLFETNSLLLL